MLTPRRHVRLLGVVARSIRVGVAYDDPGTRGVEAMNGRSVEPSGATGRFPTGSGHERAHRLVRGPRHAGLSSSRESRCAAFSRVFAGRSPDEAGRLAHRHRSSPCGRRAAWCRVRGNSRSARRVEMVPPMRRVRPSRGEALPVHRRRAVPLSPVRWADVPAPEPRVGGVRARAGADRDPPCVRRPFWTSSETLSPTARSAPARRGCCATCFRLIFDSLSGLLTFR